MVVSERKKLYEGVVEMFAHYTTSDLTLEMKLNVAGISLPTVDSDVDICFTIACLTNVIVV